jgi:hypothetical protein
MPYNRFHTVKKITGLVAGLFVASSFHPVERRATASENLGHCISQPVFYGYSFLDPDIIHKNAAYAPFLTRWGDYYQQYYFDQASDIQKDENIAEWIERFCGKPLKADVDYVVYEADVSEISGLHNSAADKTRKSPLPYRLAGNTFAEMIAFNGCTEVTAYLMFAKKCEPYVTGAQSVWDTREEQAAAMLDLIDEGMGRFKDTDSHFIKMRYAYQMVRLAHYARDWQYTVDLYNYLLPKIDRKKKSILFYWTLGHLAGALRQLGKYPEAAYRYSLIFRHCASKRTQAYRSFLIRNDDDWEKTVRLCQSDAEKSTLLILRAGGARTFLLDDMYQVYDMDPANPQLDLMLISEVQELEKNYLRTSITDLKRGTAVGAMKKDVAAQHLLDLQKFVRRVLREKQTPNPKMWRGIEGYLELLAGDHYAAEKRWNRLENDLDDDEEYDAKLFRQLEIWRCVLKIVQLDLASDNADNLAFRIRSLTAFKYNPNFEPFLQQWLGQGYAVKNHPGKAILAAFEPGALGLNPQMEVFDDLLALADSDDPILLERTMQIDTNPERIKAQLLELKGAYLLSQGQPEAALAILRKIKPTELVRLPKFSPFRDKMGEKIHRQVSDTLLLNRLEIAQKIIDLEFKAKTAAALHDAEAATFWYRIGVGYYNMSYFGYEWEVMDAYRSGYNQTRLSKGPVFSLAGSPSGNRENLDVSLALSYFEKSIRAATDPEVAARATFMAARCRQKQWFCSADCTYQPGSRLIPVLPDAYADYYNLLMTKYAKTKFYEGIVKECKWLAAYGR